MHYATATRRSTATTAIATAMLCVVVAGAVVAVTDESQSHHHHHHHHQNRPPIVASAADWPPRRFGWPWLLPLPSWSIFSGLPTRKIYSTDTVFDAKEDDDLAASRPHLPLSQPSSSSSSLADGRPMFTDRDTDGEDRTALWSKKLAGNSRRRNNQLDNQFFLLRSVRRSQLAA